ncbi:chemotaxis protein CheW [Metabacillus sp. GX 13764]|uniref:chemotaxis protein CheW n=1 Tax=Metabacillus kandeliae TaxID=2900151 RepID=UPI001E5C0354|nr:chemotaxis protein CheW [Metabacillus kandeliae]MCD7033759.1 chemotaxis protein CheW [Metabacillus kandeliae]
MAEELKKERKLIVFQLDREEYGIPVEQVQSIEKMQQITRVPRTKSFIKGVLNMRGVITPVADLRSRFGIEEVPADEQTRMIIVTLEDKEIGFIVDAANDVADISEDSIEPPPEAAGSVSAEYILGVVKIGNRLITLLDLKAVLEEEPEADLDKAKA